MPFYITPLARHTPVDASPFKGPAILQGNFGLKDFQREAERRNPRGVSDRCLVYYATPVNDPSLDLIGNSLDDSISLSRKQALQTILRLPSLPRGSTLRDVFFNIWWEHGDPAVTDRHGAPTPTRNPDGTYSLKLYWANMLIGERKVRPAEWDTDPALTLALTRIREDGARLRQKLIDSGKSLYDYLTYLGWLELTYRLPYLTFVKEGLPDEGKLNPGTTFTDSFTGTNGDELEADHTLVSGESWEKITDIANQDVTIQSNEAQTTNGGGTNTGAYQVATAMGSGEHYAEAVGTSVLAYLGGLIRGNGDLAANAWDGYWCNFRDNTNEAEIYRYDNGSRTFLGGSAYTAAEPFTVRADVDSGSNLDAIVDGTSRHSESDSTYGTANKYVGFLSESFDNADTFDDFEAVDVAAGGLSIPVAMYNYRRRRE